MKNLVRKVCIILINYYNNADTLRCVRSVLDSQSDELPFILIVDNSAVSSSLESDLSIYPYHKYLLPEENLGFAGGNNLGVRWAFANINFDYLFILNNDTTVGKDTIGNLIAAANCNEEVKVFAPCIITEEYPPRIWYAGGVVNNFKITPVINKIGSLYEPGILKDEITCFASGCAVFFKAYRNLIGEELFDPAFFMYDEDFELSIRLQEKNEKILFVSNAVVVHKCQGSQKMDTAGNLNQLSPDSLNLSFYLGYTIPNRYYIVKKHFTGFGRFQAWLSLTIYWFLKSIQFFLNFNFSASLLVLKIMYGKRIKMGSVIKNRNMPVSER